MADAFRVRCIHNDFQTMKHNSILSLLVILLGFGSLTTSCDDMLTPDMERYATGFSGKDTLYFYLGIMRNVQDMVEQNQLLGDIRSDLADTTLYSSDSVAAIATYDLSNMENGESALLNRAAYYKVVNQCNFYLAKVDTLAKKNNEYYMRKECAQVEAIRAWAYLQLVQTYGKVPFITKPVDNANTGWEKNPEAWATADNLVDLLRPSLEQAVVYQRTLGVPNYSTFNTGSVTINSSFLTFYPDLVLADLYLLRGQSKDDYKQAAAHYYYFLDQQMDKGYGVTSGFATTRENSFGGRKTYTSNASSWVSNAFSKSPTLGENITVIPSAANSSFGRVLTNVDQIYGFDSHSTNTTTTTKDETDDSKNTTTTTGQLTLTANIRSRQIAPSQAYINLSNAQNYTSYETGENGEISKIEYFEGQGDARIYGTAPVLLTSNGDRARFILKDAPSSFAHNGTMRASSVNFKFYRSIYRLRQIYLRYAEAINRAGYPRMAFAVLRNGLDFDKLPVLEDSLVYDTIGTKVTVQKVYVAKNRTTSVNVIDYITVDELRRMEDDPMKGQYLDFSGNWWSNYGIHELGCGNSCKADSLYSYDLTVMQRIKDEALRSGTLNDSEVQSAIKSLSMRRARLLADDGEDSGDDLVYEVDTIASPDYIHEANEAEINAVESLIADECALEMAFEGTRMPDLIRFARHKNNSTLGSDYGTKWLAWKIARRSLNLAPYKNVNEMGGRLYGILLNPENWYLPNPQY